VVDAPAARAESAHSCRTRRLLVRHRTVGIQRRDAAAPLTNQPIRSISRGALAIAAPGIPPEVAATGVAANGWALDLSRLAQAVAHFAPTVPVLDTTTGRLLNPSHPRAARQQRDKPQRVTSAIWRADWVRSYRLATGSGGLLRLITQISHHPGWVISWCLPGRLASAPTGDVPPSAAITPNVGSGEYFRLLTVEFRI
jgi:hypothetical protein